MKKTLLLVLLFIASYYSKASHLMGGEITWSCTDSGQYVFHMKVYRDCNGIPFGPPVSLDVHNHPSLTTISMNLISQIDISPDCDSLTGYPITCAGASGSQPGAVEEFVFESNPITISGIPPAGGWIFSWGSCCRNASISNLQTPGSLGFTLRAVMYPFQGQNTNPCYDNSPSFAERPNTITCTGYPYSYNPAAYDPELDSLVYSWDHPLEQWTGGAWTATNPPSCAFTSGYSFNNPLPDTAFNTNNVASTLNSATGEINFTSFTSGVFVTVVNVKSYKCGVLVAEIFREIQFALLACPGTNNLPVVSAPFADSLGNYTLYADTVFAGDSISFAINLSDYDTSVWGIPQYITTTAKGIEFGMNFSSTDTGCRVPPCAVLVQPIPHVAYPTDTINFGWQTTIDHLGLNYVCAYMPNTYYFHFHFEDSKCPSPGQVSKTVIITVLPTLPKPSISYNGTTLTCDSNYNSYQWYLNRFKIAGANAKTYNPTTLGLYQCRVLDSLRNGNYSDAIHVTQINGIEDYFSSNEELEIYPNPAKMQLAIGNGQLANVKAYEVNVIDMFGKKVLSVSNQNQIDVSRLTVGIYVLEVKVKEQVMRNKFVKQ